MDSLVYEIVLGWFRTHPSSATAIYIGLMILVWKGIPTTYKGYRRWKTNAKAQEAQVREENKAAQAESRRLIQNINEIASINTQHLSDINGSIKAHHNDNAIHFTAEQCYQRHATLMKDFNDKFDKTATEIFSKIDGLSAKVSYAEGRNDARL